MRNEPLHPEDIKCAIYKRGQTLEGLARLTGVNSVNIRKALRAPLFIGEQVIAQFLNVHPKELWPNRYDKDGNPLHPLYRPFAVRPPPIDENQSRHIFLCEIYSAAWKAKERSM